MDIARQYIQQFTQSNAESILVKELTYFINFASKRSFSRRIVPRNMILDRNVTQASLLDTIFSIAEQNGLNFDLVHRNLGLHLDRNVLSCSKTAPIIRRELNQGDAIQAGEFWFKLVLSRIPEANYFSNLRFDE